LVHIVYQEKSGNPCLSNERRFMKRRQIYSKCCRHLNFRIKKCRQKTQNIDIFGQNFNYFFHRRSTYVRGGVVMCIGNNNLSFYKKVAPFLINIKKYKNIISWHCEVDFLIRFGRNLWTRFNQDQLQVCGNANPLLCAKKLQLYNFWKKHRPQFVDFWAQRRDESYPLFWHLGSQKCLLCNICLSKKAGSAGV
jgi:hypothetical protein